MLVNIVVCCSFTSVPYLHCGTSFTQRLPVPPHNKINIVCNLRLFINKIKVLWGFEISVSHILFKMFI